MTTNFFMTRSVAIQDKSNTSSTQKQDKHQPIYVTDHCLIQHKGRFKVARKPEDIGREIKRSNLWQHKEKGHVIAIYNNLKVYILTVKDGKANAVTTYPYLKCHRLRVNKPCFRKIESLEDAEDTTDTRGYHEYDAEAAL